MSRRHYVQHHRRAKSDILFANSPAQYVCGMENIMSEKIRNQEMDDLFKAILTLKDEEECYNFFMDICTINELQSLVQRFDVAKMLREKKTYQEIAKETGASTATISRVNRSLNYGNDGYAIVLERMEKQCKK